METDRKVCLSGPTGTRELIGDPVRYRARLCLALESLNLSTVSLLARRIVEVADAGHRIYLAGNGGSASTVAHYACDLTQSFRGQGVRASICNLAESPSVITALANDHAFEDIFRRQLLIDAQAGDLIVLVSASGNSANVLQAARAARDLRVAVAAITGFDGGLLAKMADLGIHVEEGHYGVIEDVHLSIGHMLSQCVTSALVRRLQTAEGMMTT